MSENRRSSSAVGWLFGPLGRDDDRVTLYDRAKMLGRTAWASECQFYLLTPFNFETALQKLGCGLFGSDFLKVQEVSGRFTVLGRFPSAVDEIFKSAARLGLIEALYVMPRPALVFGLKRLWRCRKGRR